MTKDFQHLMTKRALSLDPQVFRTMFVLLLVIALHYGLLKWWPIQSMALIEAEKDEQSIFPQNEYRFLQLLNLASDSVVRVSPSPSRSTSVNSRQVRSDLGTPKREAKLLPQKASASIKSVVEDGTTATPTPTSAQQAGSTQDFPSDASLSSVFTKDALRLDTRAIARELNAGSAKLPGASERKSESISSQLNNQLGPALINREGVKYEKKFLFDGRPVTKIITPYGTYCIRHRKPGDLPELTPTPPATPVSCGTL